MDIKNKALKDLTVIQYSEINNEFLDRIFYENSYQIVYVTKKEELYGIITEGDYSRYLLGKQKDLIKTNFTICFEGELNKSEEILLHKNNRINSLPVVDRNKRLLYELYVEQLSDYNISNSINRFIKPMDNLKQLLCLLELYNIKEIIMVYDGNTKGSLEEEYRGLLSNEYFTIQERTWNEISGVLGTIDSENTLLIDLDKNIKATTARHRYLQKLKIQHVSLFRVLFSPFFGDFKSNYIHTLNMIRKLYREVMMVGMIGNNGGEYNCLSAEKGKDIILHNNVQLKWDHEDRCFSYIDENIAPEVVLSFSFFLTQSCLKINGKKVPLISLQSIYNSGFIYENPIEADMMYNILPSFIQNNIIPILIADPDLEEPITENSELGKHIRTQKVMNHNWESIDHNIKKEFMSVMQYEDESIPRELFNVVYTMRKGYPMMEDVDGIYLNLVDGIRYTEGNCDKNSSKKVFMFGPCVIMGSCTKDEDTIASILHSFTKNKYCFVNMGMLESAVNFGIRSKEYNSGDIVIMMVDPEPYRKAGFKVYSILKSYNRVPDLWNHIWDMRRHCNKVVNKQIAEILHEIIVSEDGSYHDNGSSVSNAKGTCIFGKENKEQFINNILYPELEIWRDSLERFEVEENSTVGSLVMNCNPFTLGHRYLIEYASKQVDYLYIFVVEEDKSFFPFHDRMELVKRGTKDLKNVKVVPSGSYIISTATLPGYFEKDDLQEVSLDATMDLELYATQIAPFLKINARFAGEEPLDKFTCQYNEAMKMILPKYGIKFVEIPRKLMDDEPISASRVRKKLKERDFEGIKRMVPKATYDYLVKNFS